MTYEEFNELVRALTAGKMMYSRVIRLTGALRAVVEDTGEEGVRALKDYCDKRAAIEAGRVIP